MTPAIRPRPRPVWRGAERHFRVAVGDVGRPVADRLRWLPQPDRDYWEAVVQRTGFAGDTLRFLAVSLDADGHPIPIVNTDPAMLLLLEPLGRDRTLELVGPIMLPHPWGLFVDELGPLVANDAYASRDVWERFRQYPYHSPTVVWGRDVNALLAGLAQQIAAAPSRSGPDAFDFFLVVMTLTAIAKDFGRSDADIALSLTLTLAFRPVGAFIFGLIADRYGRKIPLMADLVFYSVVEVLSGLAPNYTTFLVLRALFGIGMGAEWGVGASLVMEKVPPRLRGVVSGLLQQGYAAGYLLAALCYFFVFPHWGWRPLIAGEQ